MIDQNLKWSVFLICIVLLLSACKNEPKACKYGAPQSIFSPELEKVVSHQFEVIKQDASEQINFENGIELEIIQSGCDSIRQVFQIVFHQDLSKEKPEYFIEKSIELFHYLGSVSSKHFSLNVLSQTIQDRFHDFKLGQPLELQPNFYIKIDKIGSMEQTMLAIELRSNQ